MTQNKVTTALMVYRKFSQMKPNNPKHYSKVRTIVTCCLGSITLVRDQLVHAKLVLKNIAKDSYGSNRKPHTSDADSYISFCK